MCKYISFDSFYLQRFHYNAAGSSQKMPLQLWPPLSPRGQVDKLVAELGQFLFHTLLTNSQQH